MHTFDDIKPKARIRGLTAGGLAQIINVECIGEGAVKVVYEHEDGQVADQLLFIDDLARLELVSEGNFWTFDADAENLRLAIEASRIRLAHHFDPFLAIHTSLIDPLPHQITAVYDSMLSRQPLRFLLADDPGAGKTIMAGLLIKELMVRGDLERCLIVAPGSLVEQWQDELGEKFKTEFDIYSSEMMETSRSGNPFDERNLLIARLDVLARNEEIQEKLVRANDWDLIIVDEAHRMSASVFGNEVTRTKRYQLGQKLGGMCRHLLLMSATPHNGKEEDFQLFMALLDGDRFEGRFREGMRNSDTQDMMRRLTKEELLKFDGKPLFPERRAYTVKYELSDAEATLYAAVTDYVRDEMNRVERFADTDNKKRVNVGFALQVLQRRLASSPAAIYNSLMRRRERLEVELAEARLVMRGRTAGDATDVLSGAMQSDDLIDNIDEYSQDDIDALEDDISSTVTTAETIEQLEEEVRTLKRLETQALGVLRSGNDAKWTQLNKILDDELMTDADGTRRKLVIFTEAKDTLNYLVDKIRTRLGRDDGVEFIHGSVLREERRKTIQRFMQDKDLQILVANDAAGEGVNLQRGHLMVNYDLPWNPNKIEQRFGRIHRIGQTEVCHLWNLVAADTREGEVYGKLLDKLEAARAALKGQVFDVLGNLFENKPLKDLIWEAIQYGERSDVKDRLNQTFDGIFDIEHIRKIINEKKLTSDVMPEEKVQEKRLEMERAAAQRLQPHHIEGFFLQAFKALGGQITSREEGRYEIKLVPQRVRERDRQIGRGAPVPKRYERICFDKRYINQQPVAEFVFPGHPLLDAVIDLVHEQFAGLMRQGAIMVDETDYNEELQAVFLVEHAIHDGRRLSNGNQQTVSKKLQFARLSKDGSVSHGGIAPHLDLRRISDAERDLVASELADAWLQGNLEDQIKNFAIIELAQAHLKEMKDRRMPEIDKVQSEVQARLTAEINHWYNRYNQLREEENAGKSTRLNSENVKRRAEELEERLQRRMDQIAEERAITAAPPVVRGGLVVVPQGLLDAKTITPAENASSHFAASAANRREVELAAMKAVMEAERNLGNVPEDVSAKKEGFDIVSFDPDAKKLRFIEVKGRMDGAETVTISKNEIITGLNKKSDFALAIVLVDAGFAHQPRYVWDPFDAMPSANVVSINYDLRDFFDRAVAPS
jgi:superfamily II DNA or RNA helicase